MEHMIKAIMLGEGLPVARQIRGLGHGPARGSNHTKTEVITTVARRSGAPSIPNVKKPTVMPVVFPMA
ncbi:hypothetical protein NIIDMKKI_14030 [Mycobacterium kansasii]|uniref:Uncharacterized protein n=1 Tax=Mycobacterium kansasii TaxID=1768 RepID=A0A7G1I5E5_MYCKA|nr:hypothetical protein NIIDMKKI_14030 [Mycobacterium kansasii]